MSNNNTGPQDFAAWSSLFFLPPAALLLYKGTFLARHSDRRRRRRNLSLSLSLLYLRGHWHRFWPEVLLILLSAFFSVVYHECTTSERAFCAGRTPQELTMLDEMFAFLAMTAAVTPALYQWLPRNAKMWRAAYGVLVALVTALFVTMYQDGLEASITLPTLHGVVLGYVLMAHTTLVKPSLFWWARLLLAIGAVVAGIILRVLSLREYTSSDDGTGPQSDLYLREHAGWHASIGIGAFLFFTLLDADQETHNAASADGAKLYAPVKQPTPATPARKK